MSRQAIASLIVLYFVGALAYGTFLALHEPFTTTDLMVGAAFSTATRHFAMSAIIPLIIWALFGFRRDRALIPLVLWAVLGVLLAALVIETAGP